MLSASFLYFPLLTSSRDPCLGSSCYWLLSEPKEWDNTMLRLESKADLCAGLQFKISKCKPPFELCAWCTVNSWTFSLFSESASVVLIPCEFLDQFTLLPSSSLFCEIAVRNSRNFSALRFHSLVKRKFCYRYLDLQFSFEILDQFASKRDICGICSIVWINCI